LSQKKQFECRTASQTDEQTDDIMTPIANHTVLQYDRLKIDHHSKYLVLFIYSKRDLDRNDWRHLWGCEEVYLFEINP